MKNKYRDAKIIDMEEDKVLVMACDSCGAIGLKEHDQVKVPPYITAKYTARVSLMEVLSLGAKVMALTVNICNEPNPTGDEMIKGIQSEIAECNIDLPITISTEKNMNTSMTALGVSVVGIGKKREILINNADVGDFVYVVGIPKVGDEVAKDHGEIVDTKTLLEMLKNKHIKEIIPVGSLGIKGELDQFSKQNQLGVAYNKEIKLDLKKSAGPSTAILVITAGELEGLRLPINFIGKLTKIS